MRTIRRIIATLLALVVGLCGGCTKDEPASDPTLAVHMLDVGDGTCLLLMQGEATMLIDAGGAVHADRVAAYLHTHGVEELDYVLQTLPFADRIGGMQCVVERYDTGAYLHNTIPERFWEDTPLAPRLMEVVAATAGRVQDVSGGMTLKLGEATVEIYPAFKYYLTALDYAVTCRVTFGEERFLFTAGIGDDGIQALLDSGEDLTADVIRLYGEAPSLATALVDAAGANTVLLSGGVDRDAEMISALTERELTVWRTAISGDLVLTTDGTSEVTVASAQ